MKPFTWEWWEMQAHEALNMASDYVEDKSIEGVRELMRWNDIAYYCQKRSFWANHKEGVKSDMKYYQTPK